MGDGMEIVFFSGFSLQFLNLSILELDDLSTLQAYHMVMVCISPGGFIAGDVVLELALGCKSRINEQLHGPIYRCRPDVGAMLFQFGIELFYTVVFTLAAEMVHDDLSLLREAQSLCPEVLHENPFCILIDIEFHFQ
jgi:hypothetical protein